MDLDTRFDLDVFRSHEERIAMIRDPDCPLEVRRITAEHDLDPEVQLQAMRQEELAKRLNITQSTVNKRIAKCLKKLNESSGGIFNEA